MQNIDWINSIGWYTAKYCRFKQLAGNNINKHITSTWSFTAMTTKYDVMRVAMEYLVSLWKKALWKHVVALLILCVSMDTECVSLVVTYPFRDTCTQTSPLVGAIINIWSLHNLTLDGSICYYFFSKSRVIMWALVRTCHWTQFFVTWLLAVFDWASRPRPGFLRSV